MAVSVRLTPAAAHDGIDGLVTDAAGAVRLKARVRAVAEDNKANRAIEKLIAKRLGLSKSSVSVVSGETSRSKTLFIKGDPDDIVALLEDLVAAG